MQRTFSFFFDRCFCRVLTVHIPQVAVIYISPKFQQSTCGTQYGKVASDLYSARLMESDVRRVEFYNYM